MISAVRRQKTAKRLTGANCENTHGEVSSASVERCTSEDEADDSHSLSRCDVPCPLVRLARLPAPVDRDDTSNEVRRARQNQRDGGSEAKCLDNRWEEVLEPVGSKMHVLLVACQHELEHIGEE